MPTRMLDISFVKRVELPGRARMPFHVELYNATNFNWFTGINMDPRNAEFGKVTNTRNLPRHWQSGATIVF